MQRRRATTSAPDSRAHARLVPAPFRNSALRPDLVLDFDRFLFRPPHSGVRIDAAIESAIVVVGSVLHLVPKYDCGRCGLLADGRRDFWIPVRIVLDSPSRPLSVLRRNGVVGAGVTRSLVLLDLEDVLRVLQLLVDLRTGRRLLKRFDIACLRLVVNSSLRNPLP